MRQPRSLQISWLAERGLSHFPTWGLSLCIPCMASADRAGEEVESDEDAVAAQAPPVTELPQPAPTADEVALMEQFYASDAPGARRDECACRRVRVRVAVSECARAANRVFVQPPWPRPRPQEHHPRSHQAPARTSSPLLPGTWVAERTCSMRRPLIRHWCGTSRRAAGPPTSR